MPLALKLEPSKSRQDLRRLFMKKYEVVVQVRLVVGFLFPRNFIFVTLGKELLDPT